MEMRKQYEGSAPDKAEDKRGAGLLGVSLADYEKTGRDKAEDRRGQAKVARKGPKRPSKGRS